ncbi:hypothetical protein SK128_015244, partial [Halocaridina rubra]
MAPQNSQSKYTIPHSPFPMQHNPLPNLSSKLQLSPPSKSTTSSSPLNAMGLHFLLFPSFSIQVHNGSHSILTRPAFKRRVKERVYLAEH